MKLLFLMSVLAFLVSIVASTILFAVEYNKLAKETELSLNQLLSVIEESAAVAVAAQNKKSAQYILDDLVLNDFISSAEIKNVSDSFLVKTQQPLDNISTVEEFLLHSPVEGKELMGKILVSIPLSYNLLKAKERVLPTIFILWTFIWLVHIIIFRILNAYIIKPISRISEELHIISVGGKADIPVIKSHQNDELGRLSNDIRHTLQRVDTELNINNELRELVKDKEFKLRHVCNSSSAGLFLLNDTGRLLRYNTAFYNILGVEESGSEIDQENPHFFADWFNEQVSYHDFFSDVLSLGQLKIQDFSLVTNKDEAIRWVHCLMVPIENEQGNVQIEGVLFDVTSRVMSDQVMIESGDYDKLTGLMCRATAEIKFLKFIEEREGNVAYFLLIDLDNFKKLNDIYGSSVGDAVLSDVSQRLLGCVRGTDIVSHIAGDKFLVILLCDENNYFFTTMAEKIIREIRKPMDIVGDLSLIIRSSVGGVHTQAEESMSFDDAFSLAEELVSEVKNNGKNGYAYRNKVDGLVIYQD